MSHTHADVKVPGQTNDEIHLKALQEVLGSRWRPNFPVQLTKLDSDRVKEVETRMKKNAPAKLVINDTAHFMDSLNYSAGTAHYQLGRAYETFGEIAEARIEYRTADTMNIGPMDTGRMALRAKTLYAWLELEQMEKNKPVADSLLHELLTNYGQTMYAEQARILYVTSSRNSPGELAYLNAYNTLRDKGLESAKPPLLAIVTNFSQEDVAPRSLYALGVSYEEATRYDSALRYYKRVLAEYPYSSYALALRPRLADATTPGLPHAQPRTFTHTIANQDSTDADQTQQSSPHQLRPGMQQNPDSNVPRPGQPLIPGQLPPMPPPMPGVKLPPLPNTNGIVPIPQPPPPPIPPNSGTSH